jgi:hypothetical protein
MDVTFDSMDLPADPGLTLTAYSTEPGSPSWDALALLASWNAPAAPAPERTGERNH